MKIPPRCINYCKAGVFHLKRYQRWRSAFAAVAATAGTAFASGREIVLFFAQMGNAAWAGIAFASALYGVLCALVYHFALQTGAESFAGIYMRVLDPKQGMVVSGVHGLLMAMTVGVMLVSCGEMAALALPLRHAFWIGVLFSAAVALLLNLKGMRVLPEAGLLVLVTCGGFYIALALDARPVSIYANYQTAAELSGSVTAALMLAALHAALNASVSGGIAARFASDTLSPSAFGARCGLVMLLFLAVANGAMVRGGEKLLSQMLPTVVLAARWGTAGYYISIIVTWLCAVTTLAASLGAIVGQLDDGVKNRRALCAVLLCAALAAGLMGLQRFVEVGYAVLGWACVFSLAGLACYYDWHQALRLLRRGGRHKISC